MTCENISLRFIAAAYCRRSMSAFAKDTELVPLLRLQFRGLPEAHRKAF